MNKLPALLLAGILAAAAPLPALAQDAGAAVKSDAEKAAEAAKSAAETAKDAAGNAVKKAGEAVKAAADAVAASTDELAAKITAGASADVKAVTEATNVKIVALSSLAAGTVARAVSDAVNAKTDWLKTLRADVDGNAALKGKIETAGYKTDQVVYVDAAADGSVVVYIDDSGQ